MCLYGKTQVCIKNELAENGTIMYTAHPSYLPGYSISVHVSHYALCSYYLMIDTLHVYKQGRGSACTTLKVFVLHGGEYYI